MIPIISLSNFVNATVTVIIALQLMAKSSRVQHDGLKYLAGFFIFLAGFWALRATPGLVLQDPYGVMATNLLSYVFLFIATTSLLQVPFVFLGRSDWGAVLGIFNIVAGIIFVLGRLFNLSPHPPIVVPPYIFWQETYAPWLRIVSGFSTFAASATFMVIFFYLGYKDKDNNVVYHRSMYLAIGMAFLVFAATVFFLLSGGGFLTSLLASTTCILGLILMLRGISLEAEHPTIVTST